MKHDLLSTQKLRIVRILDPSIQVLLYLRSCNLEPSPDRRFDGPVAG